LLAQQLPWSGVANGCDEGQYEGVAHDILKHMVPVSAVAAVAGAALNSTHLSCIAGPGLPCWNDGDQRAYLQSELAKQRLRHMAAVRFGTCVQGTSGTAYMPLLRQPPVVAENVAIATLRPAAVFISWYSSWQRWPAARPGMLSNPHCLHGVPRHWRD
jgi:hypothetical protein